MRTVLVMLVLTSGAFCIGYVAGWSNGHASRALSRGTTEPEPPPTVQPPAAQEELSQNRPAPLAAQSPPSAAESSSDRGAKLSPSSSLRSAPVRPPSPARPTSAVRAANPSPRAARAAPPSPTAAVPATSPPLSVRESNPPGGVPSVFVKDTTYDYGVVLEGEAVHGQFVFENRGTAPLVVRKVSTNCGCTAALVSSDVLPPGGSGTVEASLRTLGHKGNLTKQVYLETNDPVSPRLVLKLTGTVKRDIDAAPSFVDFGALASGMTTTKTVRIASAEGAPFAITKLSASSPFVHLSTPRKHPDAGYEFDVTIGPVPELGRITSNIFIEMSSPRQPRLVIVLFGNIVTPQAGAGQ